MGRDIGNLNKREKKPPTKSEGRKQPFVTWGDRFTCLGLEGRFTYRKKATKA